MTASRRRGLIVPHSDADSLDVLATDRRCVGLHPERWTAARGLLPCLGLRLAGLLALVLRLALPWLGLLHLLAAGLASGVLRVCACCWRAWSIRQSRSLMMRSWMICVILPGIAVQRQPLPRAGHPVADQAAFVSFFWSIGHAVEQVLLEFLILDVFLACFFGKLHARLSGSGPSLISPCDAFCSMLIEQVAQFALAIAQSKQLGLVLVGLGIDRSWCSR